VAAPPGIMPRTAYGIVDESLELDGFAGKKMVKVKCSEDG